MYYSVVTSVHNVVDCWSLHLLCTLHLTCILLLYSLYTSAGRYIYIYCSIRNLVCTLNIPLLPVYTTLSTAVLSTPYVLSTYYVFFCCTACTRRLEDIEYTVVHATSYVLYCTFRCTRRLLLIGIRVYCCALCTSRHTSLLFECAMLHSKPWTQTGCRTTRSAGKCEV